MLVIKKIYFVCLISLFIIYPATMKGETRFVNKTGNSSPPFTTWETAADTIQKAIDISEFGDTIFVANGVYKDTVRMKPGITLIGSGMDSCIIDTRGLPSADIHIRAVKIKSDCTIKGFHIKVNSVNYGVGIFGTYLINVLIENNKITDTFVGIYPTDSDILIKDNIISNTKTGIFLEAISTNNEQIIESNSFFIYGDGVKISFGTKPTIRNNVFYINAHLASGSAYTGGASDTVKFFNNLIIAVNSDYSCGCSIRPTLIYNNLMIGPFSYRGIDAFSYNKISNNIIINSPIGMWVYSDQYPVIQYNNLWNNEINYKGIQPDSTNLSADPMFVDEDSLDFHLQMFSPLIDRGDPSILDKDGSRSDIGLFGGPYGESYTYKDLAPRSPRNLTASVDSNTIILKWLKNTEADFYEYRVYRDTVPNFTYDTTKIIYTTQDTIFTEIIPFTTAKTYYYKITAIDSQKNQSPPSEEAAVIITGIDKEKTKLIANGYKLYANYPNPFNPSTVVSYRLKEEGYVKLMDYDIKGELIAALINKEQEAGYYEYKLDASKLSLSSGIYLIGIEIIGEGNIPVFTDLKKMVYLK